MRQPARLPRCSATSSRRWSTWRTTTWAGWGRAEVGASSCTSSRSTPAGLAQMAMARPCPTIWRVRRCARSTAMRCAPGCTSGSHEERCMPSLTVYHVTPPASSATLALHFGRQGIGYEEASETWSSDALFAALVAQAALLEGLDTQGTAAPLFARPFLTEAPPLRHSSLFPRIGALVLLPRPALPLVIPDV